MTSTLLRKLMVAGAVVVPQPALAPTAADAQRTAGIAAQASLFLAIGMLLSAFVAAVAARIGGLRHEEMHLKLRG